MTKYFIFSFHSIAAVIFTACLPLSLFAQTNFGPMRCSNAGTIHSLGSFDCCSESFAIPNRTGFFCQASQEQKSTNTFDSIEIVKTEDLSEDKENILVFSARYPNAQARTIFHLRRYDIQEDGSALRKLRDVKIGSTEQFDFEDFGLPSDGILSIYRIIAFSETGRIAAQSDELDFLLQKTFTREASKELIRHHFEEIMPITQNALNKFSATEVGAKKVKGISAIRRFHRYLSNLTLFEIAAIEEKYPDFSFDTAENLAKNFSKLSNAQAGKKKKLAKTTREKLAEILQHMRTPGQASPTPTVGTNPSPLPTQNTGAPNNGTPNTGNPGPSASTTATPSVVPTTQPNAECGNGQLESGEECDDGNRNDADSCNNACELNTSTPPPNIPSTGSWTPPIGIPNPGFGMDSHRHYYELEDGETCQSHPQKCFHGQPYQDNGDGPYTHYIDNTHPSATNDSNPFGSPARPRLSIPADLSPGSVVEVHGGPYDAPTAPDGSIRITGHGTAAAPIFIRGDSTKARPRLNRSIGTFYGGASYMVIENLDVFSAAFIAPQEDGTPKDTHHVTLRNCIVHGNLGSGGVSITTYNSNTVHDILLYKNVIHDNGDVNANYDQDVHGIGIGATQRVWVVDNEMYRNSGDGIQINSGPAQPARYIYVGRNNSHGNKQSGFWTKYAQDVIFSQNTAWDHRPSDSSGGSGMGYQYGPSRVWFLFNHIYDNQVGIGMASASGPGFDGDGENTYVIGNIIHNIHMLPEEGAYPVNTVWAPAAILSWSGQDRHILNNTIYDVDAGINSPDSRPWHITNNIISNLSQTAGKHIFLAATSDFRIDNNLFFQNGMAERIVSSNGTLTLSSLHASGKGLGNITADPKFINASGQDFSLQSFSAAINAGKISTEYALFQSLYGINIAKDFFGNDRPANGAWDIGAIEFDPN